MKILLKMTLAVGDRQTDVSSCYSKFAHKGMPNGSLGPGKLAYTM